MTRQALARSMSASVPTSRRLSMAPHWRLTYRPPQPTWEGSELQHGMVDDGGWRLPDVSMPHTKTRKMPPPARCCHIGGWCRQRRARAESGLGPENGRRHALGRAMSMQL
jgi:hypothetical protein